MCTKIKKNNSGAKRLRSLACDAVMDSNVLKEPAACIFMPHVHLIKHNSSFYPFQLLTHQSSYFNAINCGTQSVIQYMNITHEMAVSCNPHNLSYRDTNIAKQLGYKHTFCQNVVSTKNFCPCIFVKT